MYTAGIARKTIYVLCILILLLQCQITVAQDQHKTLKLQIMEQIPYGFVQSDQTTTGVLFEILQRISAQSSVSEPVEIVPLLRIYNDMVASKPICSLFADTPEVLASEALILVEPLGFELQVGILPRKGILLHDYYDLTDRLIAVPLGIIFDDRFNNDDSLKKVVTRNYSNSIKMLKLRRVDAVAGALPALYYIAKLEGMTQQQIEAPLVFQRFNVHLICSDGVSDEKRSKLKQALLELKQQGDVKRILSRYFDIAG